MGSVCRLVELLIVTWRTVPYFFGVLRESDERSKSKGCRGCRHPPGWFKRPSQVSGLVPAGENFSDLKITLVAVCR